MAPARKFSHPASMVAVSGVLILLSASTAGERQCSWCGPLADQVHRSQRAPSCDEPGETTCENGLSHCAIIASSPPYLESRLCVKYYQDECYSIFCNSSRTWRMTCPCRGDLCNKEKTEREHEAFAFLARLGSKIQNLRIKKRTITPGKFISRTPNRTAIVTEENEVNDTDQNELENAEEPMNNKNITEAITRESNIDVLIDKSGNNNSNVTNTNENQSEVHDANSNGNENKVDINNMTLATNMNEINGNVSMEKSNVATSYIPNISRNENEVEVSSSTPNLNEIVNDMPTSPATTKIPVSITVPVSQSNEPDVKPSETSTIDTQRKDINKDVANNIDHTVELSPTKKSVDEKNSMKMDIKPSVELPAAEALQQNSSPAATTEKTSPTTEQITTEKTTNKVMITTEQIQMTTTSVPMTIKKNNAIQISLDFLPTLFLVVLYF